MKVVLDTNVLVSGLLTPLGVCGGIVRMLTSDAMEPCVDSRILFEYEQVLKRPRFRIDPDRADALISYIEHASQACGSTPLARSLPDPDDDKFLEVAISAEADCLVTGNSRHYPRDLRRGLRVLSPRAFVDKMVEPDLCS
ncbi:MAG: putative toxin-antitoxin system toxin component, PIN family [Polyangia bacterium]